MNKNVKHFFDNYSLINLFKLHALLLLKMWSFFVLYVNQGKQSISLEPGGQFELSGAPLETLHQTCAEVNSHLYQVSHMYLLGRSVLLLLAKEVCDFLWNHRFFW